MKKILLDNEEQVILTAFEKGLLKPITHSKKEVIRLTHIFKTAVNKNKCIS